MVKISKETVLSELSKIKIANNDNNIVDMGIVSSVIIKDNNVGFVINVSSKDSEDEMENLRKNCERAVANISGVGKVTAVMTGEFSTKKVVVDKHTKKNTRCAPANTKSD